jgi:hypothetical protein
MITPLRLAAIVAAGAAALGCIAAAPHAAISAAASSAAARSWIAGPTAADPTSALRGSPSPAWQSSSDSDDDYPCPFVAEPGYLEGSGGNSQVIQDDGHAYMGCGDGPTISLEDVGGDSATFELHGDRVRVREGATERLGPYRVHVIDVRGERVELELSDPD